jgi:hypothetical protein
MKSLISIRFLFSFAAVFVLAALGCYFFPRSLINAAIPLLTFPISVFHPDSIIEASLDGKNELFLDAIILDSKGQGPAKQVFKRRFQIRNDIGIIFGIPLMFYPLLFTWPGIPVRYRLKGAFLALPVMLLMISVDTSLALLQEIEVHIQEPTLLNRVLCYLAQGFSCGGRQFLGILLFAAIMAPRFFKKPIYADGRSLERNGLCPCGSGNRYKNCCMR